MAVSKGMLVLLRSAILVCSLFTQEAEATYIGDGAMGGDTILGCETTMAKGQKFPQIADFLGFRGVRFRV